MSASSAISAVGGAISNLASGNVLGALKAVGAALVGIGVQSTQMAADYQQSSNMIQSLTGANKDQMAYYDSQLKQLAVDAGVAPTALSQGLYNVMSAGYSGRDAMSVLTLATEDAKIGMTDATTTTNALTNVMKSFGVQASDATRVNGEMLATVTAGKSTFAQYASSITTAASTSVQFHESMETMNAAWATLTSSGISAGQATTDYDQSLRIMDGNIGTVAKSLQKNGIAFNEAKFNAMDYGDKVVYLNKALDEAAQKHVRITGATAQGAQAIQTIAKNISTYNTDLTTFSNRAQMAQKTQQAWAITQQGFNQQMSQLGAAFNVLMINIGSRLLPVLTQVAQWLTPIIQGFAEWVAGGMQVNVSMNNFRGVIAALQPILTGVWQLIVGIGQFIVATFVPVWQQLVAIFQTQLVPTWIQLQAALTPIMPQLQQFGLVLGGVVYLAIANFIILIHQVIGAIGGLLTGFALVISGMIGYFAGFIQYMSGGIAFFVDLFTGHWNKLGSDLQTIWGGIVKMFQGVWQAIAGVFVGAINGLIGLVNGFVQGVVSALNVVLSAAHMTTLSVGQIPMLNAPAVASGNFNATFTPVATQSSAPAAPTAPAQSGAINQSILAQLQQAQQAGTVGAGSVAMPALPAASTNLSDVLVSPMTDAAAQTTAAVNTASAKSAASAAKAQDAANARAARLADTQQKALSESLSSAVQQLVDQSKSAAAAGQTSTAAVYAQQAASLASQQHAAAQRTASQAQAAARHAATLANEAAKKAAATQRHQDIVAAQAAAQAAKLAQAVAHHKELISTILQSTDQITSNQCASSALALPTALGVALPDYATGTGYVQSAPITQQAPASGLGDGSGSTVHNYNITINTDSKNPKDHGKQVADEVKKQLAKRLRGQSIAPRYTSGGSHANSN